jgi:hypothetical protein
VKVTEAEARRILERAADLEIAGSISLADLERAASEAGISTDALAAAATEIIAARTRTDQAGPPARAPFWVRGVLATLSGIVSGGLARVLEDFVEPNRLIDVPFTVLLIVASLILAARARERADRPLVWGEIAGIWSGFMAGWAVVAREVTPDLVFGLGGFGLATAALAAVIMHFTADRDAAAEPGTV